MISLLSQSLAVDWVERVIPGELEIARVAIRTTDGRHFAAVAEWQESKFSTVQYLVVLAANPGAPALFPTFEDARRFVEAAALAPAAS